MREKLYFEIFEMDMDTDKPIILNSKFLNIENINQLKTESTKTCSLPFTPNNMNILGNIQDFNREISFNPELDSVLKENFNPNVKIPFHYTLDGDILKTGYAKYKGFENEHYLFTLYTNDTNFLKTINSINYGKEYITVDDEDVTKWSIRGDNKTDDSDPFVWFNPIEITKDTVKDSFDTTNDILESNTDDIFVDGIANQRLSYKNFIAFYQSYQGEYKDFDHTKYYDQTTDEVIDIDFARYEQDILDYRSQHQKIGVLQNKPLELLKYIDKSEKGGTDTFDFSLSPRWHNKNNPHFSKLMIDAEIKNSSTLPILLPTYSSYENEIYKPQRFLDYQDGVLVQSAIDTKQKYIRVEPTDNPNTTDTAWYNSLNALFLNSAIIPPISTIKSHATTTLGAHVKLTNIGRTKAEAISTGLDYYLQPNTNFKINVFIVTVEQRLVIGTFVNNVFLTATDRLSKINIPINKTVNFDVNSSKFDFIPSSTDLTAIINVSEQDNEVKKRLSNIPYSFDVDGINITSEVGATNTIGLDLQSLIISNTGTTIGFEEIVVYDVLTDNPVNYRPTYTQVGVFNNDPDFIAENDRVIKQSMYFIPKELSKGARLSSNMLNFGQKTYNNILMNDIQTYNKILSYKSRLDKHELTTYNEYFHGMDKPDKFLDWTDKIDRSSIKCVPRAITNKILEGTMEQNTDISIIKNRNLNDGAKYGCVEVETNIPFEEKHKNFSKSKMKPLFMKSMTAYSYPLLSRNSIKLLPYYIGKETDKQSSAKSIGTALFYRPPIQGQPFFISDPYISTVDSNKKECFGIKSSDATGIITNTWTDASYLSSDNINNYGLMYSNPNLGLPYEGGSKYIEEMCWRKQLNELYSDNCKILTAKFNLSENDLYLFEYNRFVLIDGSLWHPIEILEYNPTGSILTKVKLMKVQDVKNYTEAIDTDFGDGDTGFMNLPSIFVNDKQNYSESSLPEGLINTEIDINSLYTWSCSYDTVKINLRDEYGRLITPETIEEKGINKYWITTISPITVPIILTFTNEWGDVATATINPYIDDFTPWNPYDPFIKHDIDISTLHMV